MPKALGALNLALAALMFFGVMMAVVDLPAAIEAYESEPRDVFARLSFAAYLTIGIAAALSNGVFAWWADGLPIPRWFHLFNGLFLGVHVAVAMFAVWVSGSRAVGMAFTGLEAGTILLALLVVTSTYVFLLSHWNRATARADPTP